eukprot:1196233-Prorocentrum_minimum.AAC.3
MDPSVDHTCSPHPLSSACEEPHHISLTVPNHRRSINERYTLRNAPSRADTPHTPATTVGESAKQRRSSYIAGRLTYILGRSSYLAGCVAYIARRMCKENQHCRLTKALHTEYALH